MDPETSSTSTMSSGVVTEELKEDAEESAERETRKSASGSFATVMLSEDPPVSVTSPVLTLLSVQMRPTFSVVVPPPVVCHVARVSGSATASPSSAKAVVGRNSVAARTSDKTASANDLHESPVRLFLPEACGAHAAEAGITAGILPCFPVFSMVLTSLVPCFPCYVFARFR